MSMLGAEWIWEDRLADQQIAKDADQVEWAALLYGVSAIDEGTRDEAVADTYDDFESQNPSPTEDWDAREAIREEAVSKTSHELHRRRELLSSAYPFEIRGNGLSLCEDRRNLVYEFCLAACVAPSITDGAMARIPVVFEQLVTLVASDYLGASSSAYRSGWPPLTGQRPPRFKQVIEHLQPITDGDVAWDPCNSSLPSDPAPKHIKDGTVDVIAWIPMKDKRGGQLFLLVQCACGAGWIGKTNELNVNDWRKWSRPCWPAGPAKGFAIPYHIRNPLLLHETIAEAGITFDRARLALHEQAVGLESEVYKSMCEIVLEVQQVVN